MKFKSLFIAIFCCFFTISSLHAQYIPEPENISFNGKELSDFIYESLNKEGINSIKQSLCREVENNFPYNISIFIRNNSLQNNSRKYNTIIFVFPQDDIQNHLAFIYDFTKWIKDSKFDFNVNILLTACDKSQIAGNEKMTGSDIFAEMIEGTENYCTIYTNLDAKKATTLTPASAKIICPLWLTKLVNSSFEENRINPTIIGSFFISLYRQNILRSSKTLSSFLSRNIPAVEMNVKQTDTDVQTILPIYKSIVNNFSEETIYKNDTHYIPLELFGYHFWLSESITIILLIILFTLSLISICDLGFIFRTRHSKKTISTNRALRTLYLLPVTIIILWICLELAQFAATLMYNSFLKNPIAVLGIKLIIAFILISFAYLAELKFHTNAGTYAYEYLLRISSLINIFIFSAIDISLFYLFAVIYIIFSISLLFKKTFSIYVFFILSILPYSQLLFVIASYSTPDQIMPLIFASPFFNIAYSCAVTPLSIVLLRIYLRIKNTKNLKTKKETSVTQIQEKIKKRFPKYYTLIQFMTIIFLGTFILIATLYIQKTFRTKINFGTIYGRIIDSPENHFLQARYKDSSYYGGTIRQITINTSRPATRVEVFVTGQTENPVYYTTYTFTQSEENNQIKFNLPDYPPETFSLSYTPDNSATSIINIFAYYDSVYYPEDFILDQTNSRRKLFVKEKIAIVTNSKNAKQGEK